jgi:hypothetical protein
MKWKRTGVTAGIGLNVFLIGQRLLGVLNIAEGEVVIEAHPKGVYKAHLDLDSSGREEERLGNRSFFQEKALADHHW